MAKSVIGSPIVDEDVKQLIILISEHLTDKTLHNCSYRVLKTLKRVLGHALTDAAYYCDEKQSAKKLKFSV